MSWRDKAACAGINPDLFFPGRGQSAKQARRYCKSCQVVTECAAYAEETDLWFSPNRGGVRTVKGNYGIWGGLSDRERQALRGKTKASLSGFIAEPGQGR